MKHTKAFFFTGVDGPTGHIFRTENKPRRIEYEHLFDSTLFRLDAADSAQELEAGHIRLETDTRAKNRSFAMADGFQRAVLAHQLPVVRNSALAGDVLINTSTANGITIDEVDYINSGRIRRDYIVKNGLSITSPGGTITLTPVAGGYQIDVSAGISDTYKVMADAADPIPGYLDAKLSTAFMIDGTHRIVPKFDPMPTNVTLSYGVPGFSAQLNYAGTNTIQIVNPGGIFTPSVRYDGTYFTENASGLTILPNSLTGSLIATSTITNANFAATAFGDGVIKGGSYVYASVGYSVSLIGVSPNKVIGLVNDVLAPGNSYYYGTNAAGTKGWYAITADKWEYYTGTDDVYVRNSDSKSKAPRTVATGSYSMPWLYGALGNAGRETAQSMRVELYTAKTSAENVNLVTKDGKELWLPNNCNAVLNGIVIVSETTTNKYATFKFSCVASCAGSIVTLSNILYDTMVAPFHVVQAGVPAYASAYNKTTGADVDFKVEAFADNVRLIGVSDGAVDLTYDAFIDIFVQGHDDFAIPDYTL
jgi:hypothetical protein